MEWNKVLIRPMVTEKGTAALSNEKSKYVCYPFRVNLLATKAEIRKAVEEMAQQLYGKKVDVRRVNTMAVRGKVRRRGPRFGMTREIKKALVYIPREQKLEIF